MKKTNEEQVTKLWELYKDGINYQDMLGLRDEIPRFCDFYEGRQWDLSKVTQDTKSMPRCQINIIKPICRNKKANILAVPYRLKFSSLNNPDLATQFERFYDYQQKAMNMSDRDSEAMNDAVIKGTYIYHFYWDKDAHSVVQGKTTGAVRCEMLDPLDVFFSNPREQDEDRQKYIIVRSRLSTDSIRAIADKNADLSKLEEDKNSDDAYQSVEQENSNLCTILTRYFRKDGEVFFERATRTCIINKPKSLTPECETTSILVDETGNELIDAENVAVTDYANKERLKASLYPIVVGQYEQRNNSIYGIGEVAGIIPNQQAINQIISMQTYNVSMNAWSKWLVKADALRNQKINNNAGQVLVDYSKTGNGISKIKEDGISSAPSTIAEHLISLTRNSCGSNEVTNGEVLGANMSGSAIAQLQAQASLPTEELRNRFWITKKKCGKVLSQFFLLYYDNEKFSYPNPAKESEVLIGEFKREDFKNFDFDIQVEASGGTRATSASDIMFLETLLKYQAISPYLFAKLYPNEAIANKSEVLRILEEAENNKETMLAQENAQLKMQLQQAGQLLEKQNQVIDNATSIIKENNTLKAQLLGLYREASTKATIASEVSRQYQETREDADIFAQELARLLNEQNQVVAQTEQ